MTLLTTHSLHTLTLHTLTLHALLLSTYVFSIYLGPEVSQPEIACSSSTGSGITTGGGFSNSIVGLSYQKNAVNAYFKNVDTKPYSASGKSSTGQYQYYTKTNRAYPDVSMPGNMYPVLIGGKLYYVSGTSASSPVFAGLLSLVNAYRLSKGYSTVGLVNAAIWANAGGFTNDITSGNNKCTSDADICCSAGFYASTGWDPVTGWGSVDYAKLLEYYSTSVPGSASA